MKVNKVDNANFSSTFPPPLDEKVSYQPLKDEVPKPVSKTKNKSGKKNKLDIIA